MSFKKSNYKNIDIILSNNCNINCFFCNSKQGYNYNGDFKNVCLYISKFFKKGFNSITFSGGEPTLDNYLFIYIAYAKKIGFKFIKVQTNLLFSEEYFNKLLKLGITGLGFTYFGLNKSIFSSITGNIGKFLCYNRILNYISNYTNKIDINVDIVLNEYIIDNIGLETEKLLKLGFLNFSYKFPFYTGNNKLNYNLTYYSDKLNKYLIGKDFNFFILYIPTCYLQGLEKNIYDYKNDYIYDFKYLFSLKQSIEKIAFKDNKCTGCRYLNNCFGYLI